MKYLAIVLSVLFLSACDKDTPTPVENPEVEMTTAAPVDAPTPEVSPQETLAQILAAQSDETKARYVYRNPAETLAFFGIEPGMTVAEALPGGGWYSQILVPYLGSEGKLIGQDYDGEMWKNFDWVTDEFMAGRAEWPAEWVAQTADWGKGNGAQASAFTISETPEALNGSVDAVLFIRALHNLYRFDGQGEHLTRALDKTMKLLKPGGVVGIVQHQASEEKSDAWADGSRGYLKKSLLIARMEQAGFEFVAESDINANPKDMPGEDDSVWRLPPSLRVADDSEELKQASLAIGETNRMTLLFRKPL
jgi:predicted methyltransferase